MTHSWMANFAFYENHKYPKSRNSNVIPRNQGRATRKSFPTPGSKEKQLNIQDTGECLKIREKGNLTSLFMAFLRQGHESLTSTEVDVPEDPGIM